MLWNVLPSHNAPRSFLLGGPPALPKLTGALTPARARSLNFAQRLANESLILFWGKKVGGTIQPMQAGNMETKLMNRAYGGFISLNKVSHFHSRSVANGDILIVVLQKSVLS